MTIASFDPLASVESFYLPVEGKPQGYVDPVELLWCNCMLVLELMSQPFFLLLTSYWTKICCSGYVHDIHSLSGEHRGFAFSISNSILVISAKAHAESSESFMTLVYDYACGFAFDENSWVVIDGGNTRDGVKIAGEVIGSRNEIVFSEELKDLLPAEAGK
ncbi:hypothetical protein Tco_0593731 [Tanacetum coccineum]